MLPPDSKVQTRKKVKAVLTDNERWAFGNQQMPPRSFLESESEAG